MDRVQAGNMHKPRLKQKETIRYFIITYLCLNWISYLKHIQQTFFYHFLYTFLFQVLVEGVWGNNRVSGFIAIDDVTFFSGDCDGIQI